MTSPDLAVRDMPADAGISMLERHFREQLAQFDYSAQRPQPVHAGLAGALISAPGGAAPGSGTALADGAAGAELGFHAELGVQIGRLASTIAALKGSHDASRVAWQELHPFDLPFSPASQSTSAGQTLTSETWGPRTGWAWDLRRVTIQGLNGPVAASSNATATFAAATAGTATLPAFAALTGFVITLSAAGTAAGTVTVANVAGGPLVYDIPIGQTSLQVEYPSPLSSVGGQITVTVSAITGGGAGHIAATGLVSTGADVVTIYKAPVAAAAGAVPLAAIDNVTGSGAGADLLITQKGAFMLQQGDALLIAGAYTAANIAVSGSGAEVALHRVPWYLK